MAKAPAMVTLPGSLYQKNGRWWWKVKLPGEDKPKARALKPAGSRCATTDYQEAEARAQIETELRSAAEQRADAESEARAQAESKAKEEATLREQAEQRAESEALARAEAQSKLNEILESMKRTGTCECCGRKDIPENDLAKIDSGQRLCPDCIRMLRG